MKVLFNCHVPFSFAHGGAQIQIEQTMAGLQKVGVEVEPLRWWDDTQRGEILQHFGRISEGLMRLARQKGLRVIIADLLTEQGSRSKSQLWLQRWATQVLKRTLPGRVAGSFNWGSYASADACLALTPWEAHLMHYLFGASPAKTHVVPNGVEEVFLDAAPRERGPWLVCTATITERKRVLELAEAAVIARTPVWVIGKPYTAADPYGQRFTELAQRHGEFVRYEGPVHDRLRMAQIYREARGFALLSTMESLSLSALEAAACGCPLLLSDLPWARTVFRERASYCRVDVGPQTAAPTLKKFYEAAPNLPRPEKPLSWVQVAERLKTVYQQVLRPA